MAGALTAGLDELFAEIAAGAEQRERERVAPFEQVDLLRRAGFGALRLAVADGGTGATMRELFAAVTALSHADSNLGHLLRAHFGAVEDILLWPDGEGRRVWIERIATSGTMPGPSRACSVATARPPASCQTCT